MAIKAQLEKLQKQIQSAAKKTGISSAAKLAMVAPKRELDEETPEAEWWDRGILPNQTYDDLDRQIIDNESALLGITDLIEHPIQKEPPGILLCSNHAVFVFLSITLKVLLTFLKYFLFLNSAVCQRMKNGRN